MMPPKKYDSILIIGNGFDLNLGLKTSYQDFISSAIFERLLGERNQLCIYLKGQNEGENWIDIENELKNYSQFICKDLNRKTFRLEYQQLCSSLCEYLNTLEVSDIDRTSKVYDIVTDELNDLENLLILNYNYTSSMRYILYQRDLKCDVIHVRKVVVVPVLSITLRYTDIVLSK